MFVYICSSIFSLIFLHPFSGILGSNIQHYLLIRKFSTSWIVQIVLNNDFIKFPKNKNKNIFVSVFVSRLFSFEDF